MSKANQGAAREELDDLTNPEVDESSSPKPETASESDDTSKDTIPEDADIWASMAENSDDDEVEEVSEDSVEETPDAQKAAAAPDTEPEPEPEHEAPEAVSPQVEPEVPPAPVAPEPQPEVPPQPQPQPAPQQPAPQQPTAEQIAAQQKQLRDQYRNEVMRHYALSEEDATKFISQPEEIFPQIMANLHVNVVDAVMTGVLRQFPALLQQYSSQRDAYESGMERFFSKWRDKGLDPAQHKQKVERAIGLYAQMNPQATEEEIINNVGAMVLIAEGITPPQSETPAAPAKPPAQPRVPPGKTGSTTPQARKSDNIFTLIAEELDREDYEE